MQRDGFKCRACGDDKNTLHIHHIRYLRGRDPWEYKDFYLVTLCETCHQAEEDEIKGVLTAASLTNIKKEPVFNDTPRGSLMRRDYELKEKLKAPGISTPDLINLLKEFKAISDEMRLAGIPPVFRDDLPVSTYKAKNPNWRKSTRL